MHRRPGEDPRAAGRRFEALWAAMLGVKAQKGSGNSWWAKADVADGAITWSLKFTTHRTYTLTKELLREVREAVYKNGDNSIPGLAIAFDDGSEVVVVLSAADFVRIVSSDSVVHIDPSKADQKRHLAGIPSLLRDSIRGNQ